MAQLPKPQLQRTTRPATQRHHTYRARDDEVGLGVEVTAKDVVTVPLQGFQTLSLKPSIVRLSYSQQLFQHRAHSSLTTHLLPSGAARDQLVPRLPLDSHAAESPLVYAHRLCQEGGPEQLTELTSQIFRVLSSEAETRRLESDDQATSDIPWGAKTHGHHLDRTKYSYQQRSEHPSKDQEAHRSAIQTR